MFRNLFHPESPLMITMTHVTDCIFLSLFWLLGCIPVLTVGASFAALYDASFRGMRRGEKNSWQRFLRVYRDNWKASVVPSGVFLLAMFGLGKGLIALWNAAVYGSISWTVFSAGGFACVLALGILSLLFPMLSRFENPVGVLFRNTLILSIANAPRTVALGMLNALSAFLCVRYIFPLFFLPSLAALLGSWLIEPIFKPYMPAEEDAAG